MRTSRSIVTPYALKWALALALFAALIWWVLTGLLHGPRFTEVDPARVQSPAVAEPNPPPQGIGEVFGDIKVDVSEAQLSLSSGDGALKMRLWADEAHKVGDRFNINEGAVQFALRDHSTLLLRVTDAEYRYEAGVATVTGTLIGSIEGTEQYFSAEQLKWSQASHRVTARRVHYTGPHVAVTGDEMSVNLDTGEVQFDGPVSAAI